jgi:hypothetical protein
LSAVRVPGDEQIGIDLPQGVIWHVSKDDVERVAVGAID